MKDLKSPSYMEMRIDLDGEEPLFLRIPTFWDDMNEQWIYALRLPTSKKLATGSGKDSLELQNACNKEIHSLFQSEYGDELFKMFKPSCYWKELE